MHGTYLLTTLRGEEGIDPSIRAEIRALSSDATLDEMDVERRIRRTVGWLNRHGHVTASLELLDVVSESRLTSDRAPTSLGTTILRLRGISRRLSGDFLGAADDLMKSKVYAELAGDVAGVARALNCLGNVYGCLSHWSIAENCFEQAAEIAGTEGHAELLRTAHQNLVVALSRQGRVRAALALLREPHTVQAGDVDSDEHFRASRLLASAIVSRLAGFRVKAARFAHRALEISRDHGFVQAEAISYGLLGELALDLGDHRGALKHFREKLRIAHSVAPGGDLACEAYRGVAEAYLHRGEFDRCETALTEAWRLSCELHDDFERVALLGIRASLAMERGDPESADRTFRDAIRLCTRHGYRLAEAITLERWGFGHVVADRHTSADRHLGDAAEIFRSLGLERHARRVAISRRALSRPWPRRRTRGGRPAETWQRHGILTADPAFVRVLELVERTANTPLPVLITGESGVGKELVARAIHVMSGRAGKLVDINCPAIPESMLESELFGCTRGAFTGAEDRRGLIAGADRGTLFLDEIGEMPKGLQAKLLRFLETSTYRRLGSHAVDHVDARVVSATNARLEDETSFRQDLYHRIAGVVLEIPPLRERGGDVALLAQAFAAVAARSQGREAPVFDAALLSALETHDWPGNVRELKHVVECMVWSRPDARVLTPELLPKRLAGTAAQEEIDDGDIRRAIAQSSGSVAGAARTLGISRQKLYRKAAEFHVDLAVQRAV